ncbi:MAG: hypothetical protein ACFFE4_16550 [Candidatus Thorarchaeota archaeon]
MSGKGVLGSIIGSVVCSVLIMSALVYFMAPIFFPIPPDRDVVIQYKYGEWNTPSYIYDNELTYKKMNDTEISITIEQDSRLKVEFTALALLALDTTFTVRSSYNITLVVSGAINRTIMVLYYDGQPATGFFRELTYNLNINLLTEPLPSGTYIIELFWKSTFDATGNFNSLSVAHAPTFNYTRTLLVQELSPF